MKHTIFHDTHESYYKVGGIGSVLEGILDSELLKVFEHIFMGFAYHEEIQHKYELMMMSLPSELIRSLRPIEDEFSIPLQFGQLDVNNVPRQLLLIRPMWNAKDDINFFKRRIFDITNEKGFALRSDMFDQLWDYDGNTQKALPLLKAAKAINQYKRCDESTIVSHEYMGLVTLIASHLDDLKPAGNVKRVYWAHETAPGRKITEEFKTAGHDTMFYNVLNEGKKTGKKIWDFPELENFVSGMHRYHMMRAAFPFIDEIIAVGDYVKDELVFIGAPEEKITVVPNGIPIEDIDYDRKRIAKARLQQYSTNLGLFERPDYIITQVARGVPSKAFWRSVGIMHNFDKIITAANETAVFYLLVNVGQRTNSHIRKMEEYGWPVEHVIEGDDVPWYDRDLVSYDNTVWGYVKDYNKNHKNTKVVLINQFVTDQESLGQRAPKSISWYDFRFGTDVELNPAIYEPFGISPIEPLPYGAIIVVSNINGCDRFLTEASLGLDKESPVIIGDYVKNIGGSLRDKLNIGKATREAIEAQENTRIAQEIYSKVTDITITPDRRLEIGQRIAQPFAWNNIAKEYLLPILGITSPR